MKDLEVSEKTAEQKLSDFSGGVFTPEEISVMQNTVAKGTSMSEFSLFIKIASSLRLNPFSKEIWCIKYAGGDMLTFASRDGWHKILHRQHPVASLNSCEVREGDTFSMGTKDGKMIIEHSFSNENQRTEKKIIGAYAIISFKDRESVIDWADYTRYYKEPSAGKKNGWKTHPEEMIKKVAEVHAIKKICDASGVYIEEEMTDGEIVRDFSLADQNQGLLNIQK